MVISDRADILGVADVALRLPAGVPEWLSPVVAVVPGQLWALGFSLARGLHPDAPRGLTKVTHTITPNLYTQQFEAKADSREAPASASASALAGAAGLSVNFSASLSIF